VIAHAVTVMTRKARLSWAVAEAVEAAAVGPAALLTAAAIQDSAALPRQLP
jgi:hypothetical protein